MRVHRSSVAALWNFCTNVSVDCINDEITEEELLRQMDIFCDKVDSLVEKEVNKRLKKKRMTR